MIKRRQAGESIAYLTGRKEFWKFELCVDARVLVPRPDTETLIEEALARLGEPGEAGDPPWRIADVGTGSGALAITLAKVRAGAAVFAGDVSPGALEVARANAERLGAAVTFVEGDLGAPLVAHAPFTLIVANLPYIPTAEIASLPADVRSEPALALDGGADGLDLVRRLVADAPALLAPGGVLALEIGDGQASADAGAPGGRRFHRRADPEGSRRHRTRRLGEEAVSTAAPPQPAESAAKTVGRGVMFIGFAKIYFMLTGSVQRFLLNTSSAPPTWATSRSSTASSRSSTTPSSRGRSRVSRSRRPRTTRARVRSSARACACRRPGPGARAGWCSRGSRLARGVLEDAATGDVLPDRRADPAALRRLRGVRRLGQRPPALPHAGELRRRLLDAEDHLAARASPTSGASRARSSVSRRRPRASWSSRRA